MKKVIKLSLVAAGVLALTACNQEAKQETTVAEVKLETEIQKQAYGFGVSLGEFLQKDLSEKKELGFEIDTKLLLRGVEDALAGKATMQEEEIRALLTKLNEDAHAKKLEVAKEEAAKVKAEGEAFLAENAKNEGVVTTESGLQYQVMQAGEGKKPLATDVVHVHYRGTLINGEEFDSSYKRGETIDFPLNQVIKGWTEGVQLMNEGAKYKFFIPSELAYGERAIGNIPANSTLIFEVELVKVEQPEAVEAPAAN